MSKISLLIILLFTFSFATSQEYEKPSEGKSLVYFVRTSGAGALINFKFFDGEKFLGKMSGANYFIYECDPGNHLFWTSVENRDFIQGELKANATYIFEARPQAGAFTTRVKLIQVSTDNFRALKRVKRVLSKKTKYQLKNHDSNLSFFIKDGMIRYENIKHKIKTINPNQTF